MHRKSTSSRSKKPGTSAKIMAESTKKQKPKIAESSPHFLRDADLLDSIDITPEEHRSSRRADTKKLSRHLLFPEDDKIDYPIIFILMHGKVLRDQSFQNPFDELTQIITAAPGEPQTKLEGFGEAFDRGHETINFFFNNDLFWNNPILTPNIIYDAIPINDARDDARLLKVSNISKRVSANIHRDFRYQFIKNEKNALIPNKIWKRDKSDKHGGIYVLNPWVLDQKILKMIMSTQAEGEINLMDCVLFNLKYNYSTEGLLKFFYEQSEFKKLLLIDYSCETDHLVDEVSLYAEMKKQPKIKRYADLLKTFEHYLEDEKQDRGIELESLQRKIDRLEAELIAEIKHPDITSLPMSARKKGPRTRKALLTKES